MDSRKNAVRGRARGHRRDDDDPSSQRVSPPGRPSERLSVATLHTGLPGPSSPYDETKGNNGNDGRGPTPARGVVDYTERFDHVNTMPDGISKIGKFGREISLVVNYFPMRTTTGWMAFHYRVDFAPHLEETAQRRAVFRRFIQQDNDGVLGICSFDGHSIWSVNRYTTDPSKTLELLSSDRNGDPVTIKIRMVAELPQSDPQFLQVYNNIVRGCLRALNLTQIGRNYFDGNLQIVIQGRNLCIWPGFLTTLRQHDHKSLLYCVEITNKVIRTDSVFHFIRNRRQDLSRSNKREDLIQAIIAKEIVGTIVMTSYNRMTYRVDEVLWKESPRTTFKQGDKTVTIADYTQSKHNVRVTGMDQPLLLSNRKMRDIRRGLKDPFKLLPEFCQMTGLTDSMRSDFTLMRELSQHLFQAPKVKVESIQNFIKRLRTNATVSRDLEAWKMQLDEKPLRIQGRCLPPEIIILRNLSNGALDTFPANESADFTLAFRGKHMVSSVHLKKWIVIVPQRDARDVRNLIGTMQRVSGPIGFQLSDASEVVSLDDIRPKAYMDAVTFVHNKYGPALQLVFVILPNNKADTYAAVKKKCYIDYGLSSQCFLAKNISHKGLMSIATKVVVQMNAKLGGEPWNVAIPLKKLMVVGFDVHHGGVGSKSPSVGAMTCTTNASYGRYYSCVSYSRSREELSSKMADDLGRCLNAYRENNSGLLPDRIVFYRDGVGEGQLKFVVLSELEALKTKLVAVYSAHGLPEPMLSHIICTKRINTRVFLVDRAGGYQNPFPGTIVDKEVTLPERWDFFLIGPAARQGTVSPTNYNVIFDQNKLDADKIQRLTFKLCHLYYNWSGSVAVPAVCQYAHKLAYLTGLALGTEHEPNERLTHLLYFL